MFRKAGFLSWFDYYHGWAVTAIAESRIDRRAIWEDLSIHLLVFSFLWQKLDARI